MEFRNLDQFENFVTKKAKSFAKKIAKQAKLDFKKKIDKLNNSFLNSSDFNKIKTSLVGEYGFTPEEVSSLDNIVNAMNRSSNIVDNGDSFIIEYVNLSTLYNQPEAQHQLSGRSNSGEVVSWAEWLEEGVSIFGFSYSDKESASSRSGKGVMEEGGSWKIRPTRAFSNIAKSTGLEDAKKIMTLSVRRVRK